jgi:hypothetical protein
MLLGMGAIVVAVVPAQAKTCRDAAVSATSREYVSRSLGAFPGSWAAWREKVKADIGDGWQAWRRAEDREIRCEQVTSAGVKRWTCTRSGRPCRPGNDTAGGGGSGEGGGNEPGKDLVAIDQVLRRGMNGPQVETLQYLLREAGYDLKLDGDFGRSTEEAVRDFQRKTKLNVDGRAGPSTVEALTG